MHYQLTTWLHLCVFYSPASSYLLPVLFLRSHGVVEMFVNDGQIAGHHSASTALDEVEHFFLIRGVQVIEEDPSYAPSLSSVANIEVSVTPGEQNNWFEKLFTFHVRPKPALLCSIRMSKNHLKIVLHSHFSFIYQK